MARPTSDAPTAFSQVRGAASAGEFEDVSFTLHAGRDLGLVGLLGAGRTELALALFGMTRLERGEILSTEAPLHIRFQPRRRSQPESPTSPKIAFRSA